MSVSADTCNTVRTTTSYSSCPLPHMLQTLSDSQLAAQRSGACDGKRGGTTLVALASFLLCEAFRPAANEGGAARDCSRDCSGDCSGDRPRDWEGPKGKLFQDPGLDAPQADRSGALPLQALVAACRLAGLGSPTAALIVESRTGNIPRGRKSA